MTQRFITLRKAQLVVFLSLARFRVLIAGRRFGKTHLASVELLAAAIDKPGSVNWYIAPTYDMAKSLCWSKLKSLVPEQYIKKKDETELSVELWNGSIIQLKSADRPDRLRGAGLDLLIMDEAAFIAREVWPAIQPALADKMGRVLFISTPAGYNWLYDIYIAAIGQADWETWQFTTAQGGNVSREEIERQKANLDSRMFRQEFEASFETLAGRVYHAFDRKLNTADLVDIPTLPLLVGMDFNVNPMTAVLAVRKGGELHVLNELLIPNGNTELMASELKSRFPGRKIIVYPDPTGNARKTSAPAGQTDFTILANHGFQVMAPAQPYPTADKVNTVNAAMCNAGGVRRVIIRRGACNELVKGLDGLTYKADTNIPDKASGLDHITDALAYLVCYEFPIGGIARRIAILGV